MSVNSSRGYLIKYDNSRYVDVKRNLSSAEYISSIVEIMFV